MSSISVIVPVYNTDQFLSKCIDSILSQTLLPDEIILVNDGSDDQSGQICDDYARKRPDLVRVIHQENEGPSSARNHAIENAVGDFLFFIDSDDYLEDDALERLMSVRGDAEIVCGEMLIENPDGSTYCQTSKEVTFQWDRKDALIELCSYRYLRFSCSASLYSRSLFSAIRFPDTLCEDYSIQYQLIAAAHTVAYTSYPIYHYFQRLESRSRSKNVTLVPLDISNAQLAFFQRYFPDIVWAAESDCVFARMGIYTAYLRKGLDCPPKLLQELQTACRGFLKSVMKHDRLPTIKKLQAVIFCFFPAVYRYIIVRTEHR